MRSYSSGLAMAIALAWAPGALAQGSREAQPIQVGRALEGRLGGTEVRHTLRLAAGETVRITARSRDFDAMLKVYGPAGTEPLAEDDDSGGGTTAELTFQAERAGLYQIAISQSGDGDGEDRSARAYDLTVLAATAPVITPPRPIAPNAAQPTTVDMAQCGSGCRFTFAAKEGDRLIAETTGGGSDADPVLELRMGAEKLGEDDDGGDGLNARLVRPIGRTGTYTLVARTVNGRGSFSLALALRPPVSRPTVALVPGTPASGRITADAALTDEGHFYNSYRLHGRAGQRVVIDMVSSDFDAQLLIFGDTVLGPVQLAENDDIEADTPGRSRPQSLNSRLALTFVKDGDVEVRAVSLTEQGAYTLRVSEPPAR